MSDNLDADPRYTLDGGQWEALQHSLDNPANLGDDLGIACNVTPRDHVHARRIGAKGEGLASRVAIATHDYEGATVIYLAASQARQFAAHLMNAADEVDGSTPLVFHPPRVANEDETPHDVIDVEVIEPAETPNIVGLVFGLATLPFVIARRALK